MILRFVLLLLATALAFGANPKLSPKIKLFNGKNLDGFYTYQQGKNNDPDHVFRVEKAWCTSPVPS